MRDIHRYFLEIAEATAQRSTCNRMKVGALVVVDGVIRSSAYNGAPSGHPHCIDVGCIVVHKHCIRVVHAEQNALLRAVQTKGATLYTTHIPCIRCCQSIINCGISIVVYKYFHYDDTCKYFQVEDQAEYLRQSGIDVISYSSGNTLYSQDTELDLSALE